MTTLLKLPTPIATPNSPSGFIPPLENGDCLTAKEFHRRYSAMPHVKKAELIQGVVYMPSPVRHEFHGGPHARLLGLIAVYEAHTPGITVGDNSSVLLDDSNEPQSDICLAINEDRGGQTTLDDGYLSGAPELIAEVAASSVSYDLHQKLKVYLQFGVKEYVVWRVLDGEFDWFVLRDGSYLPHAADSEGVFRSTIFPGLWIDARALLDGKLSQAHAVLHRGLADPSHAAFLKS